ncbi:MAG: glycerol-3-phosphate 1-O-acyltransferase PlsY [Candidatus Omnitrophota bacterium]|nr:glycerol-3-phosphate 1-O-acyltransferase PlsY [Candidatus Omnitrophota bacterium]
MLWIIAGLLISYLISSLPTGYLLGRLTKRIDIRDFGSGNIGATNCLRVLGKGPGIAVLILDILKGFFPVIFFGSILSAKNTAIPQELLLIALSIACICGHNWTIFLKFKGGKGMATGLGTLLALSIKISGLKLILGLSILTWLIAFLICKIVSIASVLSAIGFASYTIIFKQSKSVILLSILFCIFAILRHKTNLRKFIEGKEKPLTHNFSAHLKKSS